MCLACSHFSSESLSDCFFRSIGHGSNGLPLLSMRKTVWEIACDEKRIDGFYVSYRAPTTKRFASAQKPSRSQALELALASQMARWRPSGEGMAQPKSFSDSWRTGLTLPCRSTFRSVCVPVGDETLAQMLRPSAAQSRLEIPDQVFSVRVRSLPPATGKNRMLAGPGTRCFLDIARVEPSGERVQFCKYHSGPSIRVSSFFSPVAELKLKKSRRLSENSLRTQTVEGERAH